MTTGVAPHGLFLSCTGAGSGELSEAAETQLLDNEGRLLLRWSLALPLLELLEDESREAQLLEELPSWLRDGDDLALLMQLLSERRLPARTPWTLELGSRGVAGRGGHGLSLSWRDPGGIPRPTGPLRDGVFLREPDAGRLSLGQLRLLEAWEELGGVQPTSRNEALLLRGQLMASVPPGDPGVHFDTLLQRERVLAVDRIRPRLAKVNKGYQLRPEVPGVPDEELDRYFYKTRKDKLGKDVLPLKGKGLARTRVVFREGAQKGLQKARAFAQQRTVLSPTETAELMTHADEVLGEDFDLSAWSERVTGLGPIVRRVVPIIKELEAQDWFEGAAPDALLERLDREDDDEDDSPQRLDLHDPQQLEELEQALEEADRIGSRYIPAPDGEGLLQIDEALRSSLAAARRDVDAKLASEDPGATTDEESEARARLGLQVQENLESLAFDRVASRKPTRSQRVPLPPHLLEPYSLRPHQEEGYRWLLARSGALAGAPGQQLERAGPSAWRGGLLADDMGLGKTLQVLAFLDALAGQAGRAGPHLVVAPVALLENWQREAQRFFGPAFEPIFQVNSTVLPLDSPEAAAARLSAQRLVLVSYETLRRHELTFARVAWDVVVLDEAQKAKNPSSQVSRVVRTLKARFRLAMTGTPVENSLSELWTLFDWAVPGLLGALRGFSNKYIKPLRVSPEAETLRGKLAVELQERIEPVFVRRMKAGVLGAELPDIDHREHLVELSPDQQSEYAHFQRQAKGAGRAVIGYLQRLFGVCAHPSLGVGTTSLPPLAEQSFPKIEKLLELLDEVHARGEKALVFANRRLLQHWLAATIEKRYGAPVRIINGQISGSSKRQHILDHFAEPEGFSALVLSPRAAGVGLNITAANHVIHYTREWNPAVEAQATDRAYRIGQDRDVHVHTLIASVPGMTTVDQRLAELLAKKRALMNDFVVPMAGFDVQAEELL